MREKTQFYFHHGVTKVSVQKTAAASCVGGFIIFLAVRSVMEHVESRDIKKAGPRTSAACSGSHASTA